MSIPSGYNGASNTWEGADSGAARAQSSPPEDLSPVTSGFGNIVLNDNCAAVRTGPLYGYSDAAQQLLTSVVPPQGSTRFTYFPETTRGLDQRLMTERFNTGVPPYFNVYIHEGNKSLFLSIDGQSNQFMEQYLAHVLLAKDDYSVPLTEVADYLQQGSEQYCRQSRADIIHLADHTARNNPDIFYIFQRASSDDTVISLTESVQSGIQNSPPLPAFGVDPTFGVDCYSNPQVRPGYQHLTPPSYTGYQSQPVDFSFVTEGYTQPPFPNASIFSISPGNPTPPIAHLGGKRWLKPESKHHL